MALLMKRLWPLSAVVGQPLSLMIGGKTTQRSCSQDLVVCLDDGKESDIKDGTFSGFWLAAMKSRAAGQAKMSHEIV
ncbi:hypothetical protein [Mesorhizobium sp. dw_380]|uniref:hypothetical protein n=1 Tax=Mesorhizobium sp. dw_380 TaxID=2812001 RepID=UPI001BDE9749|nr:hypothetical protein [Mesorhizobium sp. dw_380]